MGNSSELENFVNALGAMAETLKVFHDRLINQGFTKQEAIYLTGCCMKMLFGGRNETNQI